MMPTDSKHELGQHLTTVSGTYRSVRASLWVLALVFAAVFMLEGIRKENWDTLLERAPMVFLIWLVGGLILRGYVYLLRTSVHTGGIRGRSYWGFRTCMRWHSIESYRRDDSNGTAAIVVRDNEGAEIWILKEVAESDAFLGAVQPYFDWENFVNEGNSAGEV